MNIGEAIKRLRKELGMTQKSFAEEFEISQTYLSQIENNKKTPNLNLIESISHKAEIPLPVLLFLAIETNDVKDDKKELFTLLDPTIKKIISDIFFDKHDKET